MQDAHPYTSCPYAHPHEPAERRDLRVIPYDSVFCYDLHNVSASTCAAVVQEGAPVQQEHI